MNSVEGHILKGKHGISSGMTSMNQLAEGQLKETVDLLKS